MLTFSIALSLRTVNRPSRRCVPGDAASALIHSSLRAYNSIRRFRVISSTNIEKERIHILGVGNIGRLFAHALSKENNPPPISLLLHRPSLLEEWGKVGKTIQITTDGVPDRSSGYDVEVVPSSEQDHQRGDLIKNLIIPTKTIYTLSALSSIKDRLSSQSTILFAQNGMGAIEEVTENLFTDISSRPNYLACVMHHGLYSQGPFRSVHAGRASMKIGRVGVSQPPQYLIDKVVQARLLLATEVSPSELFRLQLEKLVINAMINPLTVIFNCRNGELFIQEPIVKVTRALLLEATQVIQSLPELRDDFDTATRFSTQNLELKILEAADKTAENISSMLQDFRAGRETEIASINGYIVKRAIELGIECKTHEMAVKMIKHGIQISVDDAEEHFPMVANSWLEAPL